MIYDDPQWPMALGLESLVGVRVFYNEASSQFRRKTSRFDSDVT
jgi:hypothetical protein